MPRWAGAVLVAAFMATFCPDAHAGRRRVALVASSALLEHAAMIALSPWDLDVLHVDWTALGHSMPDVARQAKIVATTHQVDAVAWISESGPGYALWLYDADTDQIVSRALGQLPSDTASAASVALSLKTLLRSSTVAPERERLGGPATQVGPVGWLRVEASGDARVLSSSEGPLEVRAAFGLSWWPRPFGRHFGLALGIAAGPGVSVDNEVFTGRFVDIGVSPTLRGRITFGETFALEPSLGPSLHVTHLDGAAPIRAIPVHVGRVDPALDAGLLLAFAVGYGVEIGARAGGAYALRFQRYLIDGRPILELSPVTASFGLVLSVGLN